MNEQTLLNELLKIQSVTPNDNGCLELISGLLQDIGFEIGRFDKNGVSNLWAIIGKEGPIFCLAGHTDVVPADKEHWNTDPFVPTEIEGKLFARGAADMKGGLACLVTAAINFIKNNPSLKGRLAFLLTSDEEGAADFGTKYVMQELQKKQIQLDWCLIGEPSSSERLFDFARIGRRGSLSGILSIHGQEGHVAYPQATENVMLTYAKFMYAMDKLDLGRGNTFFPKTSFQPVYVHSDANAVNVIPSSLIARFNLRYSDEWSFETLSSQIEKILNSLSCQYKIEWKNAGNPFITEEGHFSNVVKDCVHEVIGDELTYSTAGGTSDGRYIAPYGTEVIELGPINKSIHKNNEFIQLDHLALMTKTYERILEKMLT